MTRIELSLIKSDKFYLCDLLSVEETVRDMFIWIKIQTSDIYIFY
jgi:hypothetical protein